MYHVIKTVSKPVYAIIDYLKALGIIILTVMVITLFAMTILAVIAISMAGMLVFMCAWVLAWAVGVPIKIRKTIKVPGKIANVTITETYRWFTKISK